MRRAALAGLPLLALFSVPAAVARSRSAGRRSCSAPPATSGCCVADAREQVASWGAAVFTRHWSPARYAERPDSSPLAAAGKRIGLTAVAMAIVLPFAVPGLEPHGLLGFGVGDGGGGGRQGSITHHPEPDGQPAAPARTLPENADRADVQHQRRLPRDYLRMYSLDPFDGDQWTTAPLTRRQGPRIEDEPLPAAPARAPSRPARRPPTSRINDEVTA